MKYANLPRKSKKTELVEAASAMAFKLLLQPLLIFLSLTNHFPFTTPQTSVQLSDKDFFYCKYRETKTFSSRDDLAALFRFLSSKITDTGFFTASNAGTTATALCRADIQLYQCRSCVDAVSEELLRQCLNSAVEEAIRWRDFCTVRFSDQPILGKLGSGPSANDSGPSDLRNPVVVARTKLIEDLRGRAADGGALRKVAAGNRSTSTSLTPNVYAMVQCTPDLSPEDCSNCTADAAREIDLCCGDEPWAILYKPSCTIRFDINPFYNLTRLQEPLPTPSTAPTPTPAGIPGDRRTTVVTSANVTVIVVPIIVFLILVLACCIGIYVGKRMQQKKKKKEPKRVQVKYPLLDGKDGDQAEEQIISVESIQYDIAEIRAATDNYSEKLGQGGFGTVYKGILEDGTEIAVKRLSENSCQGDMEFKNEVLVVARLQHRNLVRLLGFSTQGTEKLLVYEFVHNGSLDNFIFDPLKSSNLDWNTRYKIIGGIAKGIQYIHEDSSIQIIHRDLKAGNILLDEKMNPKISDFGLARLVSPDVTQAMTKRIIGTYGYMAPEYASHGRFSIKSDVYSFGILVLEIVTGQRNENNSGDLISHAWRSWREQTSVNLIDPGLVARYGAQPEMLRCIHIALLCIQLNPEKRPSITDVVHMLSSDFSLSLPLPSEPAFYNPSSFTKALAAQKDDSGQILEPSAS